MRSAWERAAYSGGMKHTEASGGMAHKGFEMLRWPWKVIQLYLGLIISVYIRPICCAEKVQTAVFKRTGDERFISCDGFWPDYNFDVQGASGAVSNVWLGLHNEVHLEHTKWIVDGTSARSKTLKKCYMSFINQTDVHIWLFLMLIMVESWLAGISAAACFPLIHSIFLKKAVISGIFNKLSLPFRSKYKNPVCVRAKLNRRRCERHCSSG